MMLFYKFWRESERRLLTGTLAMAGYCALVVWFRPLRQASLAGASYGRYVDGEIFDSFGKLVFVLPVIFLGMGGMLRERARHTEIFTLALPVSRAQLAGAQVAVGLTCVALLAVLPALLIQPLSVLVHETYPMAEALRFSFLRFLCGVFIFAMSFLLSVVLRGEYTAPVASYMALFLPVRAHHLTQASEEYVLNPMSVMAGRWIAQSNINDPLPWTGLTVMLVAALVFIAAAIRIMERQNL